jgi:hypothetical protein
MSSNMRELTDGELDSVGGGRHHHHHHHDRWTGGGSSGGGLTGFLGGTINKPTALAVRYAPLGAQVPRDLLQRPTLLDISQMRS